jgi:hypothetical protein
MAYGSGAGGSDVTRASKDEGRQPRFVAESVKNAVELYVDIFVLAVKVREVGKHANLSVDVEGGQHIPAARTCPSTGGTLCELGEVTASYRSPVNLLLLRRCNRTARDS